MRPKPYKRGNTSDCVPPLVNLLLATAKDYVSGLLFKSHINYQNIWIKRECICFTDFLATLCKPVLIASRREVVAGRELRERDTVESVPLPYSFRLGLLMPKGRITVSLAFTKDFYPFLKSTFAEITRIFYSRSSANVFSSTILHGSRWRTRSFKRTRRAESAPAEMRFS